MALVVVDQGEGVATITLNMPDLRNPISDNGMIDALLAALEAADRDVGVRAVILTGAGTAFSSGGDLSKMGPGKGLRGNQPAETVRNYRDGIQRLPLAFQSLEVPVIAAVNGPAIGAGCDLACMCDIRICTSGAKFAESFVKVGLVPGDGGAWLLPRVVGWSRATEMALTGRAIDAATALDWGLVSRVVEPGELMPAAQEIAAEIAANPPRAVRLTKRLLREAQDASLGTVLNLSAAYQAAVHETRDHEEAVTAFLERRRPEFTGN
ncbi:crotonase/enoyl-CoA hydratase family protein [Pelagerythrobacter marensis]|uniref:Enoyl-CoA hydratase n=1 Tax=Pelagerythrobacter marensis TaxID=543877 RepID=A0A0G3X939_9SPHN|nr:crotonase/enoyl-CoA hydratase family protein [Pelagerythrobacter marensis]AKM07712.1 enoyl-CoA hydratase [Pelagerythrobacter marensis]